MVSMETMTEKDERTREQAWVALLHRVIAADRGIARHEIASESGISSTTVDRHLAGQAPGLADAIDDSLTRISAQRELTPATAVRVGGRLLEDGLPETIEFLDPTFQDYLQEQATLELMSAPEPTVLRSARNSHLRSGLPMLGDRSNS